jgi:DNA-binding transcriptional ArsR family regulator
MVEYSLNYDSIFGSLADPTRRDMLRRVALGELTISELAAPYKLTFGAVSKHLLVLEKAKIITKRRRGKEQLVSLDPTALKIAANLISEYEALWEERFNRLDNVLKDIN